MARSSGQKQAAEATQDEGHEPAADRPRGGLAERLREARSRTRRALLAEAEQIILRDAQNQERPGDVERLGRIFAELDLPSDYMDELAQYTTKRQEAQAFIARVEANPPHDPRAEMGEIERRRDEEIERIKGRAERDIEALRPALGHCRRVEEQRAACTRYLHTYEPLLDRLIDGGEGCLTLLARAAADRLPSMDM